MLRLILLSTLILVLPSSSLASILRKSISRRQSDQPYCSAIEGFECKCSYYRVTCTADGDFPSPINILPNEKHKYQSVELVISAPRDIKVTDHTFEPVKELFKSDEHTFEFRVKFEKFTELQLSSPGIFNRVYPDDLPSGARKHMALEIYNPEVAQNENQYLFQNLKVDALEVYALYPFHGSFQQLFDGANIKYLRLSGGDIRSDLSRSFTGNIGRLELAKQASALSAQNFPVYPAHEMIINAFYITEFNTDHPPNYSNLVELRVYSPNRIPANAFQQFPNIRTLSVSTDKDIDPNALTGLNNLEKLSAKESKPSLALINSVPSVKEFETNIEKLSEDDQCQLVGKMADGQVFVQGIPNGRECTCITAYLNKAAGRTPCDVHDCDLSTCASIKNSYDPSLHSFQAPINILRADGTNALYPRESQVYTTPYQVSASDREKLQKAVPHNSLHSTPEEDSHKPSDSEQGFDRTDQPEQPHHQSDFQDGHDQDTNTDHDSAKPNQNDHNQHDGKDQENQSETIDSENQAEKDGSEDQAQEKDRQPGSQDSTTDVQENTVDGLQKTPAKKGMKYLPIIIVGLAIIAVLIFGLVFYFLRNKGSNKGYAKAAATDPSAASATPPTRT